MKSQRFSCLSWKSRICRLPWGTIKRLTNSYSQWYIIVLHKWYEYYFKSLLFGLRFLQNVKHCNTTRSRFWSLEQTTRIWFIRSSTDFKKSIFSHCTIQHFIENHWESIDSLKNHFEQLDHVIKDEIILKSYLLYFV